MLRGGGGALLKWVIELSKFNIEYHPRYAIKGKVLVDFIVEMSDLQPLDIGKTLWIREIDGSSRAIEGGATIGSTISGGVIHCSSCQVFILCP